MKDLDYLKKTAKDLDVEDVAAHVLNDPRFYIWSGSSRKGQHHYGKGGLIRHTTDVVKLCLDVAERYPQHEINLKTLFLSAMFHDCGKMWDYVPHDPRDPMDQHPVFLDPYLEWKGGPHKRLIHHISRSAVEWSAAARKVGIDEQTHDDVLHAILAHHTSRQAGSPVAPATRVAWLVTLCDNISARMDDADTWDIIRREKDPG